MFINENSVAITFKLINFITLIGLVLFVFKKYAKADIIDLIDEEEARHRALAAQQKNLEMQQHDLDVVAKKENLTIERFKATIDEWKNSVLQEKDMQEKEFYKLLDTIKKRHAHLALEKENARTRNATIDIILTTLNSSVPDHFKSPQASTAYLDAIIRFMNERSS